MLHTFQSVKLGSEATVEMHHIVDKLRQDGCVFVSAWLPDRSTAEVVAMLGELLVIERILPGSGIPSIQTLVPRQQSLSTINQYSGTFGLATFPLHTDLAHWSIPPRFLVLRCVKGECAVVTHLFPVVELEHTVGRCILRRALTRTRGSGRTGANVLLPLMFTYGGEIGFRWDSLFLVPMNDGARQVGQALRHSEATSLNVCLATPGDTLVLDNWRYLHGRSAVASGQSPRRLERAYLARLNS